MFANAEIEIPCSNCSRKTKKTVAWLKNNKALVCGCGTRIEIDASQFNREMKKVQKSVDDLKRTLKRFGR